MSRFRKSLLDLRAALPVDGQLVKKSGLRLFSVPAGPVSCGPSFFQQHPIDARAVPAMIGDVSEVLAPPVPDGMPARGPLNLALVIDRSGSMSGRPLAEARRCAEMIVESLDAKDMVSVVAHDSGWASR